MRVFFRQSRWTGFARNTVGVATALLCGRLRHGRIVRARGECLGCRTPDEDAVCRRSAAGALRACREACVGAADLAVRYRTDSEAGELQLGVGAVSRAGTWHRADCERYAIVGEPATGCGNSLADREIDFCGPRCWSARGGDRYRAGCRLLLSPTACVILPPHA